MSLITRISDVGGETSETEDYFSSSIGIIFTDDVMDQHGSNQHKLLYRSPHLPQPVELALADVEAATDRSLFSHFVWNASLQLAELIEAGTLGLAEPDAGATAAIAPPTSDFNVAGLSVIELGAGTAMPSIMSGLLGARRVVVTDYPTPPVLKALRQNVTRAIQPESAPPGRYAVEEVLVEGHEWGQLETPLAQDYKHAFDRVYSSDCLWMPGQHENLRRSVAWFLSEDESARAWIVAGFHTGREKMRGFFDKAALAAVGLEVERLWERDCNGTDRAWEWDRGIEDKGERRRWLAIAVLRRIRKRAEGGGEETR